MLDCFHLQEGSNSAAVACVPVMWVASGLIPFSRDRLVGINSRRSTLEMGTFCGSHGHVNGGALSRTSSGT